MISDDAPWKGLVYLLDDAEHVEDGIDLAILNRNRRGDVHTNGQGGMGSCLGVGPDEEEEVCIIRCGSSSVIHLHDINGPPIVLYLLRKNEH